ncbi:MAG: hypothetical protein M5R36_24915 [Deltaproteobacteria bacterium]|nr:hypothetical protein [Deltaproteobacteria bacterium]
MARAENEPSSAKPLSLDFRPRDDGQRMLLDGLFKTLFEQFAADLFVHVIAVVPLEQRPRGLARPKSADLRLFSKRPIHLVARFADAPGVRRQDDSALHVRYFFNNDVHVVCS